VCNTSLCASSLIHCRSYNFAFQSLHIGSMIVSTYLGFRLPASDSMTATHGAEQDREDERGAQTSSRTESADGASSSCQSFDVSTPYMQLKKRLVRC
jgi:hypothetical protein